MTPTKEQIQSEAEARFPEYPDDGETTHHDTDFDGKQDAFTAGAEWALQHLPQWISVEECLPEDGQEVLCLRRSLGIEVLAFENNPKYGKYYQFNRSSGDTILGITHWMPLPQPPQQ